MSKSICYRPWRFDHGAEIAPFISQSARFERAEHAMAFINYLQLNPIQPVASPNSVWLHQEVSGASSCHPQAWFGKG